MMYVHVDLFRLLSCKVVDTTRCQGPDKNGGSDSGGAYQCVYLADIIYSKVILLLRKVCTMRAIRTGLSGVGIVPLCRAL